MAQVNIDTITDVFMASISEHTPARARELLSSLVRHLHDFAREVSLTHEEWFQGIQVLTRCGEMTDDKRNEFILLSDALGIESLVDAISHGHCENNETESAVLGPFYREGAPLLESGASIAQRGEADGSSMFLHGVVRDAQGNPVANAELDVWETSKNGLYEQQDDAQPDMNLRGRFRTAADGSYAIRGVRPVSYPIPYDGPTGDLLQLMGRHPYRPGHIHMIVRAERMKTLISQIYDAEDEYIDSDSVYSVKGSLIVNFEKAAEEMDVDYVVEHNVVLKTAES